jgi:carboxypeptidase Taq
MPVSAITQLKEHTSRIHDLNKISWVLGWDQRTMMPAGGAAVRAEQLATLSRMAHDLFIAPETESLLTTAEAEAAPLDPDSDEARLVRLLRRDYEKEVKVPGELRAALTRTAANANAVWVKARQTSDYASFRPHLDRMLELKLQLVEHLREPGQAIYDVLLDDYEHGITAAEITATFDAVKAGLVPMIATTRDAALSDAAVRGDFPPDQQRALCLNVLEAVGFTPDAWRLDPTVHPFASNSARDDIRITTKYVPDHLNPAFFGTLHEFGHGLYEHQISAALERTPLCRGASLGWHESQSRLWENMVGRSRAFSRWVMPKLRRHFRKHFQGMEAETFYRAVNRVTPSLIRIEADEVTYSLHIIVRFELEQALVNGELSTADLPAAWNQKMQAYLGVEVPNDSQGVLQDVHWSSGYLGYFPTYALGSILAADLWERLCRDIPDVDQRIARGRFTEIREWLRARIHQHGRKFTPRELLQRVIGRDTYDVEPFLRYVGAKFGELYEVAV